MVFHEGLEHGAFRALPLAGPLPRPCALKARHHLDAPDLRRWAGQPLAAFRAAAAFQHRRQPVPVLACWSTGLLGQRVFVAPLVSANQRLSVRERICVAARVC